MQTHTFKIEGTAPLMMQSDRLVNQLDPLKKEIQALTGKRKKSDADLAEIYRLEWHAEIYFDDQLGPYLPAANIEKCIKLGAQRHKQGKDVAAALICLTDKAKLEYEGPRTLAKLWADKRFVDIRSVVQQRARLMRCRPIFLQWACSFEVGFDEEVLNLADVTRFLADAGRLVSIGTYRPRFGRFKLA